MEPGIFRSEDYLGRFIEKDTFKTISGRETFETNSGKDVDETLFKGYIFIND